MELEKFAPLEPGTYFIDPDSDPSTPLRVAIVIFGPAGDLERIAEAAAPVLDSFEFQAR